MCHNRNESVIPRTATAPTVTTLTVSTAMMIARCGRRSATMPPTRMKPSRPAARQVATNDNAAGSSARAMT